MAETSTSDIVDTPIDSATVAEDGATLLLLGPPSGGKSSMVILLKRGLEVAPSMPELSMLLGGIFLDRADHANAKVAFARALANAPGHPEALLGFGTLYAFREVFGDGFVTFL